VKRPAEAHLVLIRAKVSHQLTTELGLKVVLAGDTRLIPIDAMGEVDWRKWDEVEAYSDTSGENIAFSVFRMGGSET
jgi:hypothetical protein